MSKDLSLDSFSKYITDVTGRIGQARQEVEEIQIGFNSAYVEWKAQHDATLERLVEAVTDRMAEIGPDLRGRIEERAVEEQGIIAERRQELEGSLIPETRAANDKVLQEGQRLIEDMRKVNPRLDKREEELKAQRVTLEQELEQLNKQIRRLSGCLVVVFNFFKVSKLDRQRHEVIGQLKTVHQELKRVREDWQGVQQESGAEQATLQSEWQDMTLKLARLQGEHDYLAEEANRDSLALKRAIRYVIDNLKELTPCPVDSIRTELDAMVELNIQTDNYQDGLGSVGSLLALLDGVTEGLRRFSESVNGLKQEQSMHSAYLPKLQIPISPEVLAFHEQWDGLAQKVRDESHLSANPTEFMATVRPVIERDLSEANVQDMFERLGQALDRATHAWRG